MEQLLRSQLRDSEEKRQSAEASLGHAFEIIGVLLEQLEKAEESKNSAVFNATMHGFYEDALPSYCLGKDTNELCEPVDPAELNALVDKLDISMEELKLCKLVFKMIAQGANNWETPFEWKDVSDYQTNWAREILGGVFKIEMRKTYDPELPKP